MVRHLTLVVRGDVRKGARERDRKRRRTEEGEPWQEVERRGFYDFFAMGHEVV